MFNVSALFKQYSAMMDRQFEIQVVIGTTTYSDSVVVEYEIIDSLLPSENFSIGNFVSSSLTLSIKTSDVIASNAKIIPYVRLNGSSGYTEWVKMGEYYIDHRSYQNGVWVLYCFDLAILLQQYFNSVLTYPATMAAVLTETCNFIGLTIDPSVVINSSYMVPFNPTNYTAHDIICFIAMAHGSSAKITKNGTLGFIKFVPGSFQNAIATSDYFTAQQTNPTQAYTCLVCTYNDAGDTFTAGTGSSAQTLNLANPFMTQSILNNVLAILNGFTYMPFDMSWRGRPEFEVGDGVAISLRDGTKITSTIMRNTMTFSRGMKESTSAPAYDQDTSEFIYTGIKTRTPQLKSVTVTDTSISTVYDDNTGSIYNLTKDSNGRVTNIVGAAIGASLGTNIVMSYPDAVTAPNFVSAATSIDGNQIIVVFDSLMINPTHHENHFEAKVNGVDVTILSTAQGDYGTKIVLNLYRAVHSTDNLTVSYTCPADGSGTSSINGGVLQSFAHKTVTNNVANAPTLMSAVNDSTGTQIILAFSKLMADPAEMYQNFSVTADGTKDKIPCDIFRNPANYYQLCLTVYIPCTVGEVLTLNYDKGIIGTIRAYDGSYLNSITGAPVTNNSTNNISGGGGDA